VFVGEGDVCTKAKYVEIGRAAGGVVGSAIGGWADGSIAGGICIALGLPSGGAVTLGCALIGGVVGAVGGGKQLSPYGAEGGVLLFSAFET